MTREEVIFDEVKSALYAKCFAPCLAPLEVSLFLFLLLAEMVTGAALSRGLALVLP